MEYNLPTNATVTVTLNMSGVFLQSGYVSFTSSWEQRGEEGQEGWVPFPPLSLTYEEGASSPVSSPAVKG